MITTVIVETVHGLKDVIVVGTGGVLAATNQAATNQATVPVPPVAVSVRTPLEPQSLNQKRA